MKKALNAWSVPPGVDFEDLFRDLAAAGFEGVELNVDAPGRSEHSLTLGTGDSELARIRRLSEDHGLPVHSISTSLTGDRMGSGDRADRAGFGELLGCQIACAQALGATAVLTVPGGVATTGSLAAAHANSLETLAGLRGEIVASGIRVGVENVWNGFFVSPFDMCRFIDALETPAIGAYFDVGNVIAFADAEHWIEILGSRIVKIHVKDFKRTGGYNRGGSFVNLLQGDVNWPAVVRALGAAGYDDFLTAELGLIEASPEYLYSITNDALDIIIGMEESGA
ncbi:MAG: sugar phosphate isomerase/epimerase family protein [Bacillota bacterium]|nr:sugar phosphate isomerase/epimerase family protein [Bacillota bacterium]